MYKKMKMRGFKEEVECGRRQIVASTTDNRLDRATARNIARNGDKETERRKRRVGGR